MIRLSRPGHTEADVQEATRVLRSGMLVQGAEVLRFEGAIAVRTARKHAIAVANGTSALELALTVLGIGPGDDVLCPALSWPSPAHAIALRGAKVVLVDVDPGEWNSTAAGFAAARTKTTKAAIVIDQFGMPARHMEIARALPDLAVVEDAACAIGSVLDGKPCGSFGDVSCLSFHPRKVITTGEGGACLTNDPLHEQRLRVLRNHGQRGPGDFSEPGGNWRLSEMAAALGASQLARLDEIVARRQRQAERYRAELRELQFQALTPLARSNWQTIGALLPDGFDANRRDRLVLRMKEEHVEVGKLSYALHQIGSLSEYRGASLPVASRIADVGFALPAHVELTDAEQGKVIDTLGRVLRELRP